MFADATEMKRQGNLPANLNADKLNPHLEKASIEMKKLLSAAIYETILGYKDDQDDEKKEKYRNCQIAEANLAMAYAVPVLNIETQGTGIVQDKGWDQSRSQMLSQNEVSKLVTRFRDYALEILEPYVPASTAIEEEPRTDQLLTAKFSLGAI